MQKYIVLACLLLTALSPATSQVAPGNEGVPVEVVATASEYVPLSTTVSHPGHAYTNCFGSTSYFGQFRSYGDFGSFSGTADTSTTCNTTFSPPTESTLTTYRRVNYTIAKADRALYLLSCTQTWKPTAKERVLLGVMGAAEGGSGSNSGATDRAAANAKGKWTECPAFGIGSQYRLTVRNTSDARLEDAYGTKPIKLEYLSSAALPAQTSQPAATTDVQSQAVVPSTREAMVHVTSTPSGCEIYVDGKFFGNTPSDIALLAGEHALKITIGHKEWSRTVQITAGEIKINADLL
jgi:PEGA domain